MRLQQLLNFRDLRLEFRDPIAISVGFSFTGLSHEVGETLFELCGRRLFFLVSAF
jgi:hypothetical protein